MATPHTHEMWLWNHSCAGGEEMTGPRMNGGHHLSPETKTEWGAEEEEHLINTIPGRHSWICLELDSEELIKRVALIIRKCQIKWLPLNWCIEGDNDKEWKLTTSRVNCSSRTIELHSTPNNHSSSAAGTLIRTVIVLWAIKRHSTGTYQVEEV